MPGCPNTRSVNGFLPITSTSRHLTHFDGVHMCCGAYHGWNWLRTHPNQWQNMLTVEIMWLKHFIFYSLYIHVWCFFIFCHMLHIHLDLRLSLKLGIGRREGCSARAEAKPLLTLSVYRFRTPFRSNLPLYILVAPSSLYALHPFQVYLWPLSDPGQRPVLDNHLLLWVSIQLNSTDFPPSTDYLLYCLFLVKHTICLAFVLHIHPRGLFSTIWKLGHLSLVHKKRQTTSLIHFPWQTTHLIGIWSK
jgi:hypothetical protein